MPDATDFAVRFTRAAFGQVDTSLVDTGLVEGLHTYRLALTDADGVTMYSQEVALVIEAEPVVSSGSAAFAKTRLTVAPNPVRAGGALVFALGQATDRLHVRLRDTQGRELRRAEGRGVARASVATDGLAAGVYYYEVETSGALRVGRVVVE